MTINSTIVNPIKLAVFALLGLMASACTQAPVKTTAAIPKVDISALPFAVQSPSAAHPPDTTMQTDAAGLELIEQTPAIAAAPAVEKMPTETSTPDTDDDRPLPSSLTSLPTIATTEQTSATTERTSAPSENIVEITTETAAAEHQQLTAPTDTAPKSAQMPETTEIAAAEHQQLTTTPETATDPAQLSEQVSEAQATIDNAADDSNVAQTSSVSVEALPHESVSKPPANGQNIAEQNTKSIADGAYDGCKIIRIYGNYISVSITRNSTETLLVSLDLPKEYNDLQSMINYIAYADFEPASYYPYEDKTPTKIAELIRNGNVQCVLQES